MTSCSPAYIEGLFNQQVGVNMKIKDRLGFIHLVGLYLIFVALNLVGILNIDWWIVPLPAIGVIAIPALVLGFVIVISILFILADTDILTKNK